ncbi:MAG TPA: VTT domain-containing protein [Chthoniobacterales bacterium]
MNPEQWLHSAGGAGIFFLTFLSEDSAALAAALLASLGKLPWLCAFVACFAGIWLGDLGLYALARNLGRPVLQRWRRVSGKLDQSEAWFLRKGWLALVMCRFVPGTRLPTFLAAGLLRMPLGRFAFVTGFLALLWAALIFAIVHQFGGAAKEMFESPAVIGVGVLATIALALIVTRNWLFSSLRQVFRSPHLQRWTQWEFWPAWLFYLPIGLNYLRLSFKYRSVNLPTSANPGMFTGGMIGESKYATLQALRETQPDWIAPGFLIEVGTVAKRMAALREGMQSARLELPVILKPDVAQRGSGFKVIRNLTAAENYLSEVPVPAVVQKYIPGPYEVGLFYYRFPSETTGRIFAITEKIFPTIVGDGQRTIEELIRADARAAMIAETYLQRFSVRCQEVLPAGQSLRLVEAGNHAQGCIFRDGMHLWSEQLEARIDEISQSIPGFYIGRYDVRFESLEALQQGRRFTILELNGAASEATSAYDATKSLGAAYRLLFRQWELVFAIAAENRSRGHAGDSLAMIFSEWRRYQKSSLCHPIAD